MAMNVEITGRHIEITPAIHSYVLKRLRKFTRIFGEDIGFHVIIDVEKTRHKAEILLKSKLVKLTGRGQTNDMYSSILLAVDKIERQALKHKSKIIETKRQRAKAKSVANKSIVGTISAPVPAVSGDGIVMEEDVHKKPMAVEEAALELSQSELPFVVFRNAESGEVNVLYRRKDGLLGLIQG
jgi:putative sigma-54 modulation protein